MSDELLNKELLLDVEGHVRSNKIADEPADEKNEDDEVEAHVRKSNVRHGNVRHD
jgi:hypothetical protein